MVAPPLRVTVDVDLAFGSGLTYNSAHSKRYGKNRMGRDEGCHAVFVTRFGFGDGKQYWRSKCQVDTKFAMIASLQHGLALAYRQHTRAHHAGLAPPLAA